MKWNRFFSSFLSQRRQWRPKLPFFISVPSLSLRLVSHIEAPGTESSSLSLQKKGSKSENFSLLPAVCAMEKNCQFNFQLVSSTYFNFSFSLFSCSSTPKCHMKVLALLFRLLLPGPISFRYQLHFIWTCADEASTGELLPERKSHFQAVFSIRDPNKKEAKLLKLISLPFLAEGDSGAFSSICFSFSPHPLRCALPLLLLSQPYQAATKEAAQEREKSECSN